MNDRPFLATAAKALLVIAVLVDLAAAVSSFRLVHLLDEAQQLGQATIAYDAEALERTHALVRTLQLAVYALGAFVLALWFRAARVLRTRLAGAGLRLLALGAILVVGGSFFWSSWVDGEAMVRLEVGALAQLVGNMLGVAAAVLLFVLVDRTSKRALHAHPVVPGVDVEGRPGHVARVVGEETGGG